MEFQQENGKLAAGAEVLLEIATRRRESLRKIKALLEDEKNGEALSAMRQFLGIAKDAERTHAS